MMVSLRSSIQVVTIVTIVILLTKHAGAELPTSPTHLYEECFPPYAAYGNYSANSLYSSNLQAVFLQLVSHASAGSLYNSTSSGAPPDQAYGVYYCRGDVSSSFCSDCVEAAARRALQGGVCFPIIQAPIFYYECMLEYSNQSKIGVLQDGAWAWWNSTTNFSSPATSGPLVAANVNTLIRSAAYGNNGSSLSGFATGKVNVSAMETVYMLVQCRPDINGSYCEACIKSFDSIVIAYSANYSAQMVYVFNPSCMLMYNVDPFYFPTTLPPPPPPPLLPSPLPSPLPPLLHHGNSSSGSLNTTKVVVPIVVVLLFLVLGGGLLICWRNKKNEAPNFSEVVTEHNLGNEKDIANVECFNFKTIESATTNFFEGNKLGEGGFGNVYKGILPSGQVIAVKRLSRSSDRHIRQFRTEVAVVAKLQHRNLVRLLGFSTYEKERILVYEFLSNLSLDKILFDTTKSINMDWGTRFKIIEGIAWGLRYLHIDSLLTIVHRDLKTSNILLDKEMSPKIADFGLARLVTVNETTVNATTIAGTMGYMAPEYVITGRCTVKSDIYSFGVIILEIISGKSIANFYDPITNDGLLHYAWRIWNEKKIEDLMDPTLQNQYSRIESERCVQIGLLCVQDEEEKRPTIRSLMSMLDNQPLELSYPTPSTFYRKKTSTE